MEINVAPATKLEGLFAANHAENKTLVCKDGRRRPTPRPVDPLLELGDVVSFYTGSKHRWDVTETDDNFTVLTTVDLGKDGELVPIYSVIDWRNGWRGPHNSWGHGSTTAQDRAKMMQALNNGSIELSTRRALFLDIKTVRRDGKLILRKHKQHVQATAHRRSSPRQAVAELCPGSETSSTDTHAK